MVAFAFYFLAALTLLAALLVVLNRDPVNCAMCMIAALVGVAGLFLLLHAWFLAGLQIIVYAGAVMVLFLFIIMLLDAEARSRARPPARDMFVALGVLVFLAAGAAWLAGQFPAVGEPPPMAHPVAVTASGALPYTSTAKDFGMGLFTRYMLPFQVTGFLLLIAMVGVIVLSRRDKPKDEPKQPL